MRIALFNADSGEDYLADLFITAMLCDSKVEVWTNYVPEYLYSDYQRPEGLYGRGYTAFCSVPPGLRQSSRVTVLSLQALLDSVENKGIDCIIYTSIWRFSAGLSELANSASRREYALIALDGEDHDCIHPLASLPLTYYKRELSLDVMSIRPISFRVPVYGLPYLMHSRGYIPAKNKILAPCDPRFRRSYVFSTQAEYYKQYSSSLFAVTSKKGGWDCLRHYEILANHCIPYFPGIQDKPTTTMAGYPVELQVKANSLYKTLALSAAAVDEDFWRQYREMHRLFMEYFYSECLSYSYCSIIAPRNR